METNRLTTTISINGYQYIEDYQLFADRMININNWYSINGTLRGCIIDTIIQNVIKKPIVPDLRNV